MPAASLTIAVATAAVAFLGDLHLAAASDDAPVLSEEEISALWDRFHMAYKRDHVYYAENSEKDRRFSAFKQNVLQAHKMNLAQGIHCKDLLIDEACVFGVTQFSDLSHDEFAATRLGHKRSSNEDVHADQVPVLSLETFPEPPVAKDWRMEGAIGKVRDQQGCGACWAHATAEEIESMFFLAGNKLPELSVQQLVSCDDDADDCFGGDVPPAYSWIQKKGGLDTEASFPYTADQGPDSNSKQCLDGHPVVTVTNFSYATQPCTKGECKNQDEEAVKKVLAAKGPLAIQLFADVDAWKLYKGGIYALSNCSSKSDYSNHAVQLVGYNTSTTTPYWILRNSWNATWGEGGFMYLAMGKNLCGVANSVTIPEVAAVKDIVVI